MGKISELHASGVTELPTISPQKTDFDVDAFMAMVARTKIPDEEIVFQTYADKGCTPPTPSGKLYKGRTYAGISRLNSVKHDHDVLGLAVAILPGTSVNGSHRAADIRNVYALVIDDIPPPENCPGDIQPTFSQETSQSNWQHWFVLESPIDPELALSLTKRMVARLGGDKRSGGRAHCFRVAGSWNRKAQYEKPFKVKLVEGSSKPISVDALLEAYPEIEIVKPAKPAKITAPITKPTVPSGLSAYDQFLASAREALTYFPMDDYTEFIEKTGMPLHHETNGSPDGLAIWKEAASKSPKYNEAELNHKWQSFGKHPNPVGKGTLFTEAKKYGCDLAELGRKYPSWSCAATRAKTQKKLNGPTTWNRNRRKGRFLQMPYDLLGSKRIHKIERGDIPILLAMYERHDGKNNGNIEVTAPYLQSRFKVGKDTCGQALKRIVAAGFAVCTRAPKCNPRGGGTPGRYELTSLPTCWVDGQGYRVAPKLCWNNEPARGGDFELPRLEPTDDAWGNPEAKSLPGSPNHQRPSVSAGVRSSRTVGSRSQNPSQSAGVRHAQTAEFHPDRRVQSNFQSTTEGEAFRARGGEGLVCNPTVSAYQTTQIEFATADDGDPFGLAPEDAEPVKSTHKPSRITPRHKGHTGNYHSDAIEFDYLSDPPF